MLDSETKRRIDSARDILVGKVPDPKSQVEQITLALIYKFMDDMDAEAEELGGERTFFTGEFARYGWAKMMDVSLGAQETLNRYAEAIEKMKENQRVPQLFRDIFKNAFLPYRDPETLKSFLKIINGFTYEHSEKLGDAFEYLLSVLGSQGDAGQFRTPRHIIDFMVELVDPKKEDRVLDPACGTAGFLISAYKHIVKQNRENEKQGAGMTPDERTRLMENFEGYDISPDMVRLSLVNLYLHGFTTPKIFEYDTLTSEERWKDYADVILANPPFMSPKGGIRPHKRFSVESNRSEVLFVDYITEHLTPNGRAAVIVPEGVIFQTGTAYKALRKMLVKQDYLVGVISLPAGVFNPYSGVKTSILWIDREMAKKTRTILFCRIEGDGYDLGAQRRLNNKNDLPGVLETIKQYRKNLEGDINSYSIHLKNINIADKCQLTEKSEYNLSFEKNVIKKRNDLYTTPRVPLKEVCSVQGGFSFKSEEYTDFGIRIIRIGNVQKGEIIDYSPKFIDANRSSEFKEFLLNERDILISLTGNVGRVGRITKELLPAALNQRVAKLKTKSVTLEEKFLFWVLNNEIFEILATDAANGMAQKNLSLKWLQNVSIPIPKIDDQIEIVTEIESYEKIIEGARTVVENYRPRIEVDPSWPVVKLGEVCTKITDGTHRTPNYIDNGIPFLRVTDITLSNDSKKFISAEEHKNLIKRCHPEKGDVLYSKNGTIGVAKLVNWDFEFSIFVSLALLKPDKKVLSSEYLELIMNSENVFAQAKSRSKSGTVTNLHLIEIKDFQIPLPSISQQELIVEKTIKEQSLIDATKELITVYEGKIHARVAKVWGE